MSYIKYIDIWFVVCTCFIFFSLLEFSLVNIIWRRKYVVKWRPKESLIVVRDSVHLKKLTSGRILAEGMRQVGRAAFTTPSVSRRNSMAESESKKSESPFSRRISKEERFGSKTSVCSSGGCGVRFSFILLNIFSEHHPKVMFSPVELSVRPMSIHIM